MNFFPGDLISYEIYDDSEKISVYCIVLSRTEITKSNLIAITSYGGDYDLYNLINCERQIFQIRIYQNRTRTNENVTLIYSV